MIKNRIKLLKKKIKANNLDGFIISTLDEFLNEYTPEYNKRLEYISGFTGSNAICLILKEKNILFTDKRYLIQAKRQVRNNYEIIDLELINIESWLKNNLNEKYNIGFDPNIHTEKFIKSCSKYCSFISSTNFIDEIWHNKKSKLKSRIFNHSIEYSGKSALDKIENLYYYLEKNQIDYLIMTDPSLICWLLNIRGNDIEHNPIILSYLIVDINGDLKLFTDSDDPIPFISEKFNIIKTDINKVKNYLILKNKKVHISRLSSPYIFISELEKNEAIIIDEIDPSIMNRAVKNQVEIENSKLAHIKDGIAICKFLYWLDEDKSDKTELSLVEKLEYFRKEDKDYIYPSFSTICGFKSNGAIIHYKTCKETNIPIIGNGILLIDSGGQYKLGTTDVTRTIAIGKIGLEERGNFTKTLKGHISLSSAIFPVGTSGYQLDVLARYYLWQNGLDYGHGTGHGVGSFLSVHEGPQRISKNPDQTILTSGMILSNEPGYYKEKEYGIRIENLIYVTDSEYREFLKFEILTMVPIDFNMLYIDLLTFSEKQWLFNYHEIIYNNLSKFIYDIKILKWLEKYKEFYSALINY